MKKLSINSKITLSLIGGIIIGLGIFQIFSPKLAPTDPRIIIGENNGRIITFDVASFPTPNFLFKQDNHLPVIFYPAVGDATPKVTFADGRTMSYQEFVTFMKSEGNDGRMSFSVNYKEDNVNELGYIMSIREIKN